jgi:hypothetical protein
MRALLLLVLATGCTDSALDEDTAYRRLLDRYDSYDGCLADKTSAGCYDTMILCANRRVLLDLENRPTTGHYDVDGTIVTAQVDGETIVFDLNTRSSSQMPGRHSWELAKPSFYGCDVE